MDEMFQTIGLVICVFVLWFMWSPESLAKAYHTVFEPVCTMPVEAVGEPLEAL